MTFAGRHGQHLSNRNGHKEANRINKILKWMRCL